MKAAKAGHQEVIELMLQGQCQVNLQDKVSLKSTNYKYIHTNHSACMA